MVQEKKVLIVGLGIAGSVLAHTFRKRKIDFSVVDSPSASQSSRIAAGIWNPIVFKRMTKSWMADEVIPAMHSFFQEGEVFCNTKWLRKKKMLKFFTEKNEADLWEKKYPELNGFIDKTIYFDCDALPRGISSPAYGYSYVTESGNIDSKNFITSTRRWLENESRYQEKNFQFEKQNQIKDKYLFENCFYDAVILCEGWNSMHNPFFGAVKFKPAKGELLHFHSEGLNLDDILNKGVFILPMGKGEFACGATYEWNELNDETTQQRQEQLEKQLQQLVTIPYKVVGRFAGVRPSVMDRRPVIGSHPEISSLCIFNGFGTKAVMLTPYFAEHFCDYLIEGKNLVKDVDVLRFFKN